jgi:hypothetical protein
MASPSDDELVEQLLERIFAALTDEDLRHVADVLERDPEGFGLSMRGAVRGMLDDAIGRARRG